MTVMAIVQICGVFLLVALVQAQSEGCYNSPKCARSARAAIRSQNKAEICRLAPSIIQCAELENAKCDHQTMAAQNKLLIDNLKITTAKKICDKYNSTENTTTLTLNECSVKFQSCITSEVNTAVEEKEKEIICTKLPTVIGCLKNAQLMCPPVNGTEVTKVTQMYRQVANFEKEVADTNCSTVAT